MADEAASGNPARSILTQPAPPATVRIPYGAGPQQFGDLRLPAGGPHVPVVVVLHGGYWRNRFDLEYAGHLSAALTAKGLATWNIEYRRLGDMGAGWPGTFLDVGAAIDALRQLATQYPLDLARIVTLGHSAGGQLALWAAARHRLARGSDLYTATPLPIAASVSLAGVVDLRRAEELALSEQVTHQLIGGAPHQYPARYDAGSPFALLPLGVPQVLVHGTADANVPFELSAAYEERARALGDDATLLTLPGTDHFELVDPTSTVWPQIEHAVLSLATPPGKDIHALTP